MNRTEERKLAAQLRAVDARELIRRSLPVVLPHLTPTHIDQLQRVLDVAVINADIENRGSVLDQQSIKGRIVHSSQHLRNPTVVAQRDKVLAQKASMKPGENAVLVDHSKLLHPSALKPTSDNPDEAGYLLIVADVYDHRGVWLVLDSSMGAMTQQMATSDPRKWRVRLLLGYKPGALVEEIKTENGSLTRGALLSVAKLGAGYYEWVHRGPTMMALKRILDQLKSSITRGRDEHIWWSAHRGDFPVVSTISDKFGRAEWPNESIWNQPHQIYTQALKLLNDGKLTEASKFAALAAFQAQWCARAVGEYIEATLRGASRVKSILEIAVAIGQVADLILGLLFVGQGVFRLLSRRGSTLALEGTAQRQLPPGGQRQLPAPAEPAPVRPGTQTVADQSLPPANPAGRPKKLQFDTDLGTAISNVRRELGLPPLPARTVSQLHYRARGMRADKEFFEWLQANPDAPWPKKFEKMNEINERWRVRGMPGEE